MLTGESSYLSSDCVLCIGKLFLLLETIHKWLDFCQLDTRSQLEKDNSFFFYLKRPQKTDL